MPADLTIGDYHLAHLGMKQYNHWGSSQVSSHTDKGTKLINWARKSMSLYSISEHNAVHYNTAFFRPTYVRWNRGVFSTIFQNKGLSFACQHWSVEFIDGFVSYKVRLKSYIAKVIKLIK